MKKSSIILFCNIIFILYLLELFLLKNMFIGGLLISLMIFIVPGVAVISVLKRSFSGLASCLLYTITSSFIIFLVGQIIFLLLNFELSAFYFFVYLVIITNILLFFGKDVSINCNLCKSNKKTIMLFIFFLVLFSILSILSLKVVPVASTEEIDVERTCTIYGLMNHLAPYCVTDRQTYLYFAHPLLSHMYNGYSVLLFDHLNETKYYYDNSIELMSGNISYSDSISHEQVHYLRERPYLLFMMRVPSMFLAALVSILIIYIVFNITNSLILSILAGSLYISLPEIFIRGLSTDYTAVSNLFLLFGFSIYLHHKDNFEKLSKQGIIAGSFLALVNHKSVILPLAILLQKFILFLKSKSKSVLSFLKSISSQIVVGFIFGLIIYIAYGLIIDKTMFFIDFINLHIVYRVLHINSLNYPPYLSPIGLWIEFITSIGILFAILGFGSLIINLKKWKKREGILLFWFLVGGFLFTIIDWRQTKHLMLVIPSFLLSIFFVLSRIRNRLLKNTIIALILLSIIRNILIIYQLSQDISYMYTWIDW